MSEEAVSIRGFLGAALHCGIKEEEKEDLSLIYSNTKARVAGVFTSNVFQAPPVEISRKKIGNGWAQAIITNSGNANAATGEQGRQDALQMSLTASRYLQIEDSLMLVASTGVIGKRLPMGNIERGIEAIVPLLKEEGIVAAQRAMMTTDKFSKIACRTAQIAGREIRLCTIAKGAGMIQPHMATLLSYTLTDANIEGALLDRLFREAIDKTLNRISVDGCMSTNDTALILANGCAENPLITAEKGGDAAGFYAMLEESLQEIAAMIVADGEGATKIIEVLLTGALDDSDAQRVAYAIGNSNLVKTAFYGCDPNLGRIIGAIGASGATIEPQKVRVGLEDVPVFAEGVVLPVPSEKLVAIMSQKRIKMTVSLGFGEGRCRLLFSDLSHEYVDINAHYCT